MLTQCPACEKNTGMEIITRPEDFEIKGEKVSIKIKLYHCKECGAEISAPKELGDPFKTAYQEYRKRKGMIQPDSILALRKKYGLTQKELSSLLGFGEITLSRYENGSLQDQAHDNILKLAMNPSNLLELVNQNKDAIGSEKFDHLQEQLRNELSLCQTVEAVLNSSEMNEYSGYTSLNINKLIEVIKLLCFNREIFKTKLMKLLFYSDFAFFKVANRSITGLQYIHLTHGPVPDRYELILGAIMQIDPSITLEPREIGEYSGEVVQIAEPPTVSFLSNDEKKIITEISKKYSIYTSKDISVKSHAEAAYKKTKDRERISYSFAKDINY